MPNNYDVDYKAKTQDPVGKEKTKRGTVTVEAWDFGEARDKGRKRAAKVLNTEGYTVHEVKIVHLKKKEN